MRDIKWTLATFSLIFIGDHWFGFWAALLVGASHALGYAEGRLRRRQVRL